jgi:hypothetical protein
LSRQAAMSNIVDFCNPLLPAPSQDPCVMVHEGMFHALNTDGRRIFLRRSFDVLNLFAQPAVTVWKAPSRGPASKHLWAPELHLLDGRWLIYYAADDGRKECRHRGIARFRGVSGLPGESRRGQNPPSKQKALLSAPNKTAARAGEKEGWLPNRVSSRRSA